MHSPSSPFECPAKIHVKLNAHCQIKRTSFPGAGAFNLTNVHLLFQVSFSFSALVSSPLAIYIVAMQTESVIHGRTITPEEVEGVRKLLRDHPDWSRLR